MEFNIYVVTRIYIILYTELIESPKSDYGAMRPKPEGTGKTNGLSRSIPINRADVPVHNNVYKCTRYQVPI